MEYAKDLGSLYQTVGSAVFIIICILAASAGLIWFVINALGKKDILHAEEKKELSLRVEKQLDRWVTSLAVLINELKEEKKDNTTAIKEMGQDIKQLRSATEKLATNIEIGYNTLHAKLDNIKK